MNQKIIDAINRRIYWHYQKAFINEPSTFLGNNFETVLNFWVFHDSLSREQFDEVNRRWARKKFIFNDCLRTSAKKHYREIGSALSDNYPGFRLYSEELASNILMLMEEPPGENEIAALKIYENL